MLEHAEQLVDRVRPEGVEHIGPVEGDAHGAVGLGAVVRQVGQVLETRHVSHASASNDPGDTVDRAHGPTVVAATCPGDPTQQRLAHDAARPAPMSVRTEPAGCGPTARARATRDPAAGPGRWTPAEPGTFASGREELTTNQRMEIQAALEAVPRNDGPAAGGQRLDVRRELLPGRLVARLARARLDQQRRKPVANRDLWEPLVGLYVERGDVAFGWVKGHSGDQMNDLVDGLAVAACRASESEHVAEALDRSRRIPDHGGAEATHSNRRSIR